MSMSPVCHSLLSSETIQEHCYTLLWKDIFQCNKDMKLVFTTHLKRKRKSCSSNILFDIFKRNMLIQRLSHVEGIFGSTHKNFSLVNIAENIYKELRQW